jgi:ribonuclease PH
MSLRPFDELRPWTIEPAPFGAAPGRVIVRAGLTTLLCTASIEPGVPPWMVGQGRGWITAEYNMLPGSTAPRKARERSGKVDGRTTEIQRLIGRSLRAVVDLQALGERSITVDCDVLEADGGTRTAAITGGYVALVQALRGMVAEGARASLPLRDSVAAVSVGIVEGRPTLDLDYSQDFAAAVDMNVVMTGAGRYVELQGTGEEATFDSQELEELLHLARTGIAQLTELQRRALEHQAP